MKKVWKVCIDPGHGGYDPGAVGITGTQEKDVCLKVTKKIKKLLETHVDIETTRKTDEYLTLNERSQFANTINADLFLSIHCNSATNNLAAGIETFVINNADNNTKKLADMVQTQLINETKATNRGVKEANFAVLRETTMPAILVEIGFLSNLEEENKLKNDEYINKISESIVKSILTYLDIDSNIDSNSTFLNKKNTNITSDQLKKWAKNNNATETFINNADIYYVLCHDIDIDVTFAYAQYAYETGFGKYGGVVDESFCNPCGLKINAGGDCKDPNAHQKFQNWKEGIMAHIDHIALYVGLENYPKTDTLDPRHFPYLLGLGATVDSICQSWCPSNPNYGKRIKEMMEEIATININNTIYNNQKTLKKILINNEIKEVECVMINNHNYVKLRDLESAKIKIDYQNDMPVILCF